MWTLYKPYLSNIANQIDLHHFKYNNKKLFWFSFERSEGSDNFHILHICFGDGFPKSKLMIKGHMGKTWFESFHINLNSNQMSWFKV